MLCVLTNVCGICEQVLVYMTLSRLTSLKGLCLINYCNVFKFHYTQQNGDKSFMDEFSCLEKHALRTVTDTCLTLMWKALNVNSVAMLNMPT